MGGLVQWCVQGFQLGHIERHELPLNAVRSSPGADKMYHLATPGEACSTWTTLGSTVDLICQSAASGDAVGGGRRSRDPARTSDKAAPCAVSGLRWQRLVVGRALNITDSDKFGVWETIPGWGVSTEQRISLLRVRDVRAEDVGTYRCEMVCDGVERRVHHQAQLVLRQPEKNYGNQTPFTGLINNIPTLIMVW